LYVPSKIRTECAMRSFSYKKSGSLNRDWRVRSTISTDRAYSRARYRAVAAPVDFKLCTDVRKYRLSAQNEISLFFHQGNSESRYKERRTRFFRRIPHFPRSRGARAPGMWLFQDIRLDKSNYISILPEVHYYCTVQHYDTCTTLYTYVYTCTAVHGTSGSIFESTFEGTKVLSYGSTKYLRR